MSIKKSDKVAVTGGTGFLGSHILRGLVEQGYSNIFALKREESTLDLLAGIEENINWVEGDILDISSLENLVSGAKFVIHSAAKVSYNPKERKSVYTVNVEGTANMINVCLSAKVGKFIFLSSVAAIGRTLDNKVIDEETKWHDNGGHSNYGISKHLAELEVWRGMAEGLDVGILNPSMILGPSFWGESSTKLFTYIEEQRSFYPTGANGFVDVRDVAKLAILFMESEVKNKRIIAVSEMYSYEELLSEIAIALDVKAPTKALNPFMSSLIWRLSSFQSDPAITKETVQITSGNHNYDNKLSRKLFNFTYHSVKASIKDTALKLKESRAKKMDFAFFTEIFD